MDLLLQPRCTFSESSSDQEHVHGCMLPYALPGSMLPRVYASQGVCFPAHIPSVSGTNAKEYGSMSTTTLHIFCVLRCPEIPFIHHRTDARAIFTYNPRPRQGSHFMGKTQITFESILRSVNSFDVKNDDSIIEAIP